MVKKTGYHYILRLLLVFLGINVVWYAAALLINMPILPSPFAVYASLFRLGYVETWLNIGYSLFRVFAGMLLALLLGLLIGLLMGRSAFWNKLLDPVVYLTYPVPKIALLPVVMLFFGLGEISKILMIMLILIFQVIISARDGIKAIPGSAYEVLSSIGASALHKFWHVTLPGALSVILSTVRISLGTAISVLFFTEIYGTEHGMGFFIMDSWQRLDYPGMYAGILLFSLVGFILFLLVDVLDHIFMKWRRS
ncbi:NitT/TauT family transport system permease protein [Paenibacillus sophorae]|uniref:ABC transporter permease subunit n=1 Tax=Paenibacillus sophorae TaxID=1333845 RepID=A0A1H8QDC4_9BACL|nr:ABC transporter permease subunit [Paenibacillus sophorae]QWU15175.1 ABC transporter permease subunit [Paenibacillus sophorae]SEO52008.1 NitT/TauT family transport system permease protein [Paenibacillus sophorae]